jgi:hypothetical protein
MKALLCMLLLACGDNIVPPDASEYTYEPPIGPPATEVEPEAPSEPTEPPCLDKHLPKHKHKCRHNRGIR